MTAATGTQAVDRAALLVSTVVESDEPVAFAELAEGSGLPKSTVSRLLTALERTQLVERTEGGEYVAGGLFARFASRYESVELARVAQPVLRALGDITGETVNLGIPRGDTVLHVAQVDSTFLLGTRDWTGVEVPNHASALGKVLLAAGVIRMTGSLIALTDRTIADRAELATALNDVRRQGWAATVDELEVGLAGVAAPVFNGLGEVVAALGISGPTPRLAGRHEALAQLLTDQAAQLTAVLGHSPKEGVA